MQKKSGKPHLCIKQGSFLKCPRILQQDMTCFLVLLFCAYYHVGQTLSATTGRRVFAEGLTPSAKALQPSAKDLPRAALGEEPSGKKTSAKDSLPRAFYRALGKVFAEG